MRFLLIQVPARLVCRCRRIVFCFSVGHPVVELLAAIRLKILNLACGLPP